MVKVPAVLIFVPPSCKAPVALRFAPVIVPEALIEVAPEIAPAPVIPPLLLLIPPETFAPPAETVKPFAEVIDPVPVVAILPAVERLPSSEIVSLLTPPDNISSAVPVVPLFVSLMIRALPVPALVREKEVALPESVVSS